MPEKQTIKRAQRAQHEGKSPSTQAGEFVREEIHHIREGKHGRARPSKRSNWFVQGAPRRCKSRPVQKKQNFRIYET